MVIFIFREKCFLKKYFYERMFVTNKLSHSVFTQVFLESCLTNSWVWTAISVSVETETCAKSLEWTFVKFMTKIVFFLVLTNQASILSLPSLHVPVADTYVSLREQLQSQVLLLLALTAILELQKSALQEESINMSSLTFLILGLRA